MDAMSLSEQCAVELALSPERLKRRLLQARRLLIPELRARFKRSHFDFPNRRLLSDDGRVALQWQTRRCPSEPESYHNQQCDIGAVYVRTLAEAQQ
jgi:hypothetical protein